MAIITEPEAPLSRAGPTSAAGGVGLASIELAKAYGARVVAAVSSDEHKRPLVPMETRKKMINHKDSSVTGEHYDRWDYFEEKAAGWQIWSNWLDELLK